MLCNADLACCAILGSCTNPLTSAGDTHWKNGLVLQVGTAQGKLLYAIQKSRGGSHERIIKAVASACLEYGFLAGDNGYML